jgi:hypothetical protein
MAPAKTSRLLAALVTALAAAAVAQAELIDFDSIATGTPLDGLTIGDATFTAPTVGSGNWATPTVVADPTNYLFINGNYIIGPGDEGNLLTVDFASPMTDVAFGFGGGTVSFATITATVTAYDAGGGSLGVLTFTNDIQTVDPSQPGSPFIFEGLADLSSFGAISSFDVSFSGYQLYKFDSLAYTAIPTPGALALLGVAGVAGSRRRRIA